MVLMGKAAKDRPCYPVVRARHTINDSFLEDGSCNILWLPVGVRLPGRHTGNLYSNLLFGIF